MASRNQPTRPQPVRQAEQQIARKQYAALAAHYGTIGSGAIRAALQFRKPAKQQAK